MVNTCFIHRFTKRISWGTSRNCEQYMNSNPWLWFKTLMYGFLGHLEDQIRFLIWNNGALWCPIATHIPDFGLGWDSDTASLPRECSLLFWDDAFESPRNAPILRLKKPVTNKFTHANELMMMMMMMMMMIMSMMMVMLIMLCSLITHAGSRSVPPNCAPFVLSFCLFSFNGNISDVYFKCVINSRCIHTVSMFIIFR